MPKIQKSKRVGEKIKKIMMKKVCLAMLVVAGALMLTSCNKEKQCKCTTKVNGETKSEVTVELKDGKCSDMNSTMEAGGISTKTTCRAI